MYYTLGQAAKATGKTKPTISHAIKKGRISAHKDDMGQYQIDPAELHRVYPILRLLLAEDPPQSDGVIPPSYTLDVTKLEGVVETLKATIRGLEAENAAKERHITTLMALLPPPAASQPSEVSPKAKPASLFPWPWLWPFGG